MKLNSLVCAGIALLVPVLASADLVVPAGVDVTFNANGGSPTPKGKSYSKPKNSSGFWWAKFGTLPSVARAGYKFAGWTGRRDDYSTKISSSDWVDDIAERYGVVSKSLGKHEAKYRLDLWAYWGLIPPKPSAADGKKYTYVKVTWPKVLGAVKYKLRRATSKDYAKATTVKTTTGREYNDRHPAACPGKKYYYWVVPYDKNGRGFKDKALYDVGYTHK